MVNKKNFPISYILPDNNSMSNMMTIIPNPPLGKYPQFLLCDQVGSAPTINNIKTMSNILLIAMTSPHNTQLKLTFLLIHIVMDRVSKRIDLFVSFILRNPICLLNFSR